MSDQIEAKRIEQRKHGRLSCDGTAEVVALRAHAVFRGKITDISPSGCFIATRARLNLARYAEVEVRFMIHGSRQAVLARVMAVVPGKGAGFEFLTADPRLDRDFQRMLEKLQPAEPAKV